MATVTRYVNTASSAGGDGTTNATSGANRAYVSMVACEAAEQTDLVAAGDILDIIAEGSAADTARVNWLGWTTDSSNYVNVRTTLANRHDGKWDNSSYRLDVNGTSVSEAMKVTDADVRLEGLQIGLNTAPGSAAYGIYGVSTGGDLYISHCIIRSTMSAGGNQYGVNSATSNTRIWNTFIYNFEDSGIQSGSSGSYTVRAYNVTIINCRRGFRASGNVFVVKNCLGDSNGDVDFTGTFTSAEYNASSDGTAPGTNSRTSQTFTFVDAGGDDYHLASGDGGAKDFGVDLSSDPNLAFSDDIDGDTRSGSWDIGADEFVGAPPSGRIMGSLAGYGGLAGHGGLAGPHGGLAG